VTDQAVLRSLFASGDAARERATELALKAAKSIYASPHATVEAYALVPAGESTPSPRVAFGLALAPLGWPAACGRVVFAQGFAEKLLERLRAAPAGVSMGHPTFDMSRSWVHGAMPSFHGAWFVRVYAGGAAAVAFSSDLLDDHIAPHEVMTNLEKAWQLAANVLTDVGAVGEARLALHLQTTSYPPGGEWTFSPKPQIDILRAAAVDAPRPADLESIEREHKREAGNIAWEPDPGS
jgi:hypothetical protein